MVQINMSIPESCAECRLSVRHFGKLYCPALNDRVGNEGKDSRCPLMDAEGRDDLISRQTAIDVINVGAELLRRVLDDTDVVGAERAKYEWGLGLIESYISDMKALPSAQPTLTNAESNTELSVDLISRTDALSCFHDWIDKRGDVHTADEMPEYQRIEQLPSAQPEESMNCAFCKLSRCESDKECHWKVRWNDADANA